MKNDKKIFIPFRKWNQLQNESHSVEADKQPLTLHLPAFNYHNGVVSKRAKSDLPTTVDIQNTIDRTGVVLKEQKEFPIEVRRAMLLSNVFTEKANQLEFTRALRQFDEEKEKAEKDRLRRRESSYQNTKQANRKSAVQKKLLLKRSLLDELQKMKVHKKELHQNEIKNEREELQHIADKLHEAQQEVQIQALQKKRDLKKMFSEDLHEKQEYRKFHFDEGRCETKCILSPKKRICAKKDFLSLPKEIHSKRKTTLAIISVPITKKSFLEMKREVYEKKLKDERIRMYENQMKERMEHKNRENSAKKIEYEQRLQNLDVTDVLQQRKHREQFKKILENRSIWNKQCAERRSKFEKERLEDRERLLKLQKDMKKEDEEFFKDINGILDEFTKQGKNILPIIKCIKEFEKSKIPQSKQWPQQLCSSFDKSKDSARNHHIVDF